MDVGVKMSIFNRPAGPAPHATDVVARVAGRGPNGTSLAPIPVEGETETGRFLVGYLRALSTFNDHNRPIEAGETAGLLLEACEGGGEVLVTDRRLIVSVMVGTTWNGSVDADRGRLLLLDIPFPAIDAIERRRKKGLLGGVKERAVRVTVMSFPVLVVDLEPLARVNADGTPPERIGAEPFAHALVTAVCASRLADPAVNPSERDLLLAAQNGRWSADGNDLVVRLSA